MGGIYYINPTYFLYTKSIFFVHDILYFFFFLKTFLSLISKTPHFIPSHRHERGVQVGPRDLFVDSFFVIAYSGRYYYPSLRFHTSSSQQELGRCLFLRHRVQLPPHVRLWIHLARGGRPLPPPIGQFLFPSHSSCHCNAFSHYTWLG